MILIKNYLRRTKKYIRAARYVVCLMFFTATISAQDLDPRAYARVPVDLTLLVTGFVYTYGSVVSDPTLPIQDLMAKVESPLLAVGRTFSLFGLTSQLWFHYHIRGHRYQES